MPNCDELRDQVSQLQLELSDHVAGVSITKLSGRGALAPRAKGVDNAWRAEHDRLSAAIRAAEEELADCWSAEGAGE